MKPGPELDALVAEHVMNYDKFTKAGVLEFYVQTKKEVCEFKPSTSIAHAWEVVENICYSSDGWDVSLSCIGEGRWFFELGVKYKVKGVTAPHAICLAALKAKGVEVE